MRLQNNCWRSKLQKTASSLLQNFMNKLWRLHRQMTFETACEISIQFEQKPQQHFNDYLLKI
jgi:hypothetical protein